MIYNIELNNREIILKGIQSITDFYFTIAIDYIKARSLFAVITGCDSPYLNVIIDTRTTKENSTLYINKFIEFFNKSNVPWAFMVTPVAKDNDLAKCGFSLLEEVPSMYFDLSTPLPNIDTSSLIIQEMSSDDDLSRWIQPLAEGFPSKDNGEHFRKLNVKLLRKGEAKLRQFVGFYEGEAVTAGTLFLSRDSVMLHSIATRVAFQRRGFGSAFTLHLMNVAKKLRFKHCFLDASAEGFNLYKKLGFKIYCTTLFYQMSTQA